MNFILLCAELCLLVRVLVNGCDVWLFSADVVRPGKNVTAIMAVIEDAMMPGRNNANPPNTYSALLVMR